MYKEKFKTGPIRLYREDLFELESIINREIPNEKEDRFNVRIEVGNRTIEKNNLESLFRESLPNTNDNIAIKSYSWNGTELEKIANIHLYYYGTVIIEGLDEVWVNGMKIVLKNFFNERKTWLTKLFSYKPYVIGGVLGLSFVNTITSFADNKYILGIIFLKMSIVALIFSNPNIANKVLPDIKIYYHSKRKTKPEISTVLTIIAAILTIITNVFQVIADLFN